jgi:hypothetical protein
MSSLSQNTGIVGLNPTRGMDIWVRSLLMLPCVGSGLKAGWSPAKESYRLSITLRNWSETTFQGRPSLQKGATGVNWREINYQASMTLPDPCFIVLSCLAYTLAVKMEVICSSRTSIPEDETVHSLGSGNLWLCTTHTGQNSEIWNQLRSKCWQKNRPNKLCRNYKFPKPKKRGKISEATVWRVGLERISKLTPWCCWWKSELMILVYWCYNPLSALSYPIGFESFLIFFFAIRVLKPQPQPPNLEVKELQFVWSLPFDLSDLCGATRSFSSPPHSSRG